MGIYFTHFCTHWLEYHFIYHLRLCNSYLKTFSFDKMDCVTSQLSIFIIL